MNIVRWDPFRELEEVSSRLNRFFGQPAVRRGAEDESAFFADWAPAVDVQETETEYLVKADLPEVKKEDVKVDIKEGILSVEGERRQEKEEKGKKFHRIERSYGKFVRRLAVPTDVDEQKVGAEFKDGVLQVHLPKTAAAKPRAIDIKVA
jgi:HSP20 family protein